MDEEKCILGNKLQDLDVLNENKWKKVEWFEVLVCLTVVLNREIIREIPPNINNGNIQGQDM